MIKLAVLNKSEEDIRRDERERIRQRVKDRRAKLKAELSALDEVEAVLEEEKPTEESTTEG